MNILLVEDDHYQAQFFMEKLAKEFPYACVKWMKTESVFRKDLNRIVTDPPDIVVIDVMLRWTDPVPEMPEAPDEVKKEGFYRAGFRCQELLSAHKETANIPILLYTVLEASDLEPELKELTKTTVKHLRKQSDLTPLFEEIRRRVLPH